MDYPKLQTDSSNHTTVPALTQLFVQRTGDFPTFCFLTNTHETAIQAIMRCKLVMGSSFHYPTIIHYEDLVCVLDCRKTLYAILCDVAVERLNAAILTA